MIDPRPVYPGAALGGTAQRVIRFENLKTELQLPIMFALTGAIAVDLAWVLVVAAWAVLEEWALILVGLAGWEAVYLYIVKRAEALGYGGYALTTERYKAHAYGCLLFVVLTGASFPIWHSLAQGYTSLGLWVEALLVPMGMIPVWGWALGLALVTIAALRGKGKAAAALGALWLGAWSVYIYTGPHDVSLLWGWVSWSTPAWDGGLHWRLAWARLKYLALPLVLSPPLFLLSLALHNWYETLIGGVWPPQTKPLEWGDLGLLGMFAPGLVLAGSEEDPIALPSGTADSMTVTQRDVRKDGKANHRTRSVVYPRGGVMGLVAYAQALLARPPSANFSETGGEGASGALDYGYTQKTWRSLRGAFEGLGYAEPTGVNQGHDITDKGYRYLARLVARHKGIEHVPAWARALLDADSEYTQEELAQDVGQDLDLEVDPGPRTWVEHAAV